MFISLVIIGMFTAQPAAPDASPSRTPTLSLERRPYAIDVRLLTGPGVPLDDRGRDDLVGSFTTLARRFVGAPWALRVAFHPGDPLERIDPAEWTFDDITASDVGAAQPEFDLIWAIRIDDGPGAGWTFTGRGIEPLTRTLGPIHHRATTTRADVARTLLRLALDLWTPRAEIASTSAGGVNLTVQAAALAPSSPLGKVVGPGSLFVVNRLLFKPDGSSARILPIDWTYLRVESVDGPSARCAIVSGLRDPLSRRVAVANRMVAVGVRPGAMPARLRFETRPPNPIPAAGYVLTIRPNLDVPAVAVGTTDREGRIIIDPDQAGGLVIARLVAGGVEPLVEFPLLPGEGHDERLIRIDPMTEAVALEARLDALRDEIVDVVARRARLEARLKARAEGNAWEDVRTLIPEIRALPSRPFFESRLKTLRDEGQERQDRLKVPVLTRAAQAQVSDIEALIARYLDDDLLDAYEQALKEYDTARAQAAAKKANPAPPPAQAAPADSTPKAAPALPPGPPM
jgi:hypothetical protein